MRINVLMISAFGYMGGDVAMYFLSLPHLNPKHFNIHIATVPRGDVFNHLQTMPHTHLHIMEMGGKEFAPARPFGKIQQGIEAGSALARLIRLVIKEKIDLIYTLDRAVSLSLAYSLAQITGKPLVLNAQISYYLQESNLHQRVLRYASLVSVSSQYMQKKFTPYAEAEKFVIIPNAIRTQKYDPAISGNYIRTELNIPASANVVVLAGRLSPFKGQLELIEAAKLILPQVPNCYFLLAGREDLSTGGYQAKLEQLILEHGLMDRVKLIGHRQDLPAIFSTATVVTMPSYEEAFGLVALEGMAMGKPVVATRAGGVPEFLVDGKMGYLIMPHDVPALSDRILTLLQNPTMAQQMGLAGRQQVLHHYNDQLYGKRIAKLLSRVAGNMPAQQGMPAFTLDN